MVIIPSVIIPSGYHRCSTFDDDGKIQKKEKEKKENYEVGEGVGTNELGGSRVYELRMVNKIHRATLMNIFIQPQIPRASVSSLHHPHAHMLYSVYEPRI